VDNVNTNLTQFERFKTDLKRGRVYTRLSSTSGASKRVLQDSTNSGLITLFSGVIFAKLLLLPLPTFLSHRNRHGGRSRGRAPGTRPRRAGRMPAGGGHALGEGPRPGRLAGHRAWAGAVRARGRAPRCQGPEQGGVRERGCRAGNTDGEENEELSW
jgi:hypothetical protein